jgi:hypothetical protein
MSNRPPGDEQENRKHDLHFGRDFFVFDGKSKIYRPKTEKEEQEPQTETNRSNSNVPFITDIKRDKFAFTLTALASIASAASLFLFCCYTWYTRGQWTEMIKVTQATGRAADNAGSQADSMIDQLNLQREMARLDKGGAKLRIGLVAVYHDKTEMSFGLRLQNYGNRSARAMSICARTENKKPLPATIQVKCFTFDTTIPNQLEPSVKVEGVPYNAPNFPLPTWFSATGKIYIWGVLKYTDYTGSDIRDPFCKEIPAHLIFDSPSGIVPGRGYSSNNVSDCSPGPSEN